MYNQYLIMFILLRVFFKILIIMRKIAWKFYKVFFMTKVQEVARRWWVSITVIFVSMQFITENTLLMLDSLQVDLFGNAHSFITHQLN